VDPPVLRATTQLACFADEHNRRIRLLHEEEQQYEGDKAHEAADVLRPPPAQVALCDEAANEGRKQRAHEDGRGEDGDGEPPQPVVEHVCEDGGDDGERGGAEDAGEEAADEYGLKVFRHGNGDAEDCETEGGDDERGFAAVELGEGRPHLDMLATARGSPAEKTHTHQGPEGIAKHEQARPQRADDVGHAKLPRHGRRGRREDRTPHSGAQRIEGQYGADAQLLPHRPVLRVQRVVGAVELDHVLLAVRQRCRR
jgi:hypothetical protein